MATLDERHDFIPLAFDARRRRRQLVRQGGFINDSQDFGEFVARVPVAAERGDTDSKVTGDK